MGDWCGKVSTMMLQTIRCLKIELSFGTASMALARFVYGRSRFEAPVDSYQRFDKKCIVISLLRIGNFGEEQGSLTHGATKRLAPNWAIHSACTAW